MAVISKNTGSVFFRGLNAFWTRVFKDSKVFDDLYSAAETLFGDTYLDLMEGVLSKSIRSTPVFSKKDWQLLLLTNTDASFDPAVYSHASSTALGLKVSVTALELSSEHDEISIELTDSIALRANKRVTYPTYGVYNVGLVENSKVREHSWVVLVPTGDTVFNSVMALSRRIISQKKIQNFVIEKVPTLDQFSFALKNKLERHGTWNATTNKIDNAGEDLPEAVAPSITVAGNEGHYYEVDVAGPGWEVGDWIVSVNGSWEKAEARDPILRLRYGQDLSGDLVLPSGNYGDLESIRDALDTLLKADSVLGPFAQANRLKITIEGGHLAFSADKDIFLWDANTSCENQLFFKEFRFRLTAAVPPGRENEIMWAQSKPILLQTSGYREAGAEYRFPIDSKIKDAKYIYNTIYAPSVILEKNKHFRIEKGFIYFKDNPFALESLAFRDIGAGVRQLALWMTAVSVDNLTLYFNYGYRFTKLTESSENYKSFLQGMWYYFTHGPQVEKIRSALNIIAGIPVVAENDELVLGVSGDRLTVFTDKNTYVLDPKTPTVVSPGQTLQAFDTLTDTFEVEDYISHPNWYNQILIPENLMPNAPIGYRISSVETFIPKVGDAGFICGDVLTDAAYLETNAITEIAPGNYSLPASAFFVIEKDRNGAAYQLYIPSSMTVGTTTLEGVSQYLLRASKQLMGNSVDGAGGTLYRLISTAKFTVTYKGVSYPITVTPTDTQAVTSLSDLALVIENKLLAATGGVSPAVEVYGYLANNALVFMPTEDTSIKLSNLNAAATSELGLFPSSSLTGITIKPSGKNLVFASTTVGQSSRIDIFNMDTAALSYLGMRPFRQGSGDFFGPKDESENSPHPTASPGWDIMDKYLKYNTFRVKFNPSIVDLSKLSLTVPEIVSKGRPLYTSAIILPEYRLQDVVSTTDLTVDDLSSIGTYINQNTAALVDRRVYSKASLAFSHPEGFFWRKDGIEEDAQYFQWHAKLYAEVTFANLSSDEGKLRFVSKEPGLTYIDHEIEITDQAHIKVADASVFGSVGVYNRGKAIGGIFIPATQVGTGVLGGIYAADLKSELYARHWVNGFDKAKIPPYATHVFVIDQNMRDNGLTPVEKGVTVGDFITLKNFVDKRNNGEFAIVGIVHQTPFPGEENEIVDLLFYRHVSAEVTTYENFVGPDVMPTFATVSFRSKGSGINHQWIIVLPATGTISQQIAAVMASELDDKTIFPFDIEVTEGTWQEPWTGLSGEYYYGKTHNGNSLEPAIYGEVYKTSWDHSDSADVQAHTFWDDTLMSPKGAVIGEPYTQISDFESKVPEEIQSALQFQGAWNAYTGLPSLPAADSSNLGHYYLIQVSGEVELDGCSTWNVGDWLYSDGTAWVRVSEDQALRVIANPTPFYTREDKAIVKGTLSNTWGIETDSFDPELVGGPVNDNPVYIPNPYLIGVSRFGSPLYTKFRASQKLGKQNWIKYGEMAFWRAATAQLNDYFGPGYDADYGHTVSMKGIASFIEPEWSLAPSEIDDYYHARDTVHTFGVHLQQEPYEAGLPSPDVLAGVIGDDDLPGGYVIGGDTLWCGVIGPYDQEGPIVANVDEVPTYFAFLELTVHTA